MIINPQKGQRVEILVGSYRGDTGRIVSIRYTDSSPKPRITVYTDSNLTLPGYYADQLKEISE